MNLHSLLPRSLALLTLSLPLHAQNGDSLIIDAIRFEDGSPWIALQNSDRFGESVCTIGDLDGNGIDEIAVGAIGDDQQVAENGAIWVFFMESTGVPSYAVKFDGNYFLGGPRTGRSLTNIGDVDGDGFDDLAVGRDAGLLIFFMTAGGVPHTATEIEDGLGGFVGPGGDRFGWSVGSLGDFDFDGTPDIVVGSEHDDDGATDAGAIWILLLNPDGTVKAEHKISNTQGNLNWPLDAGDEFGTSVTGIGDLNHDGVTDIAVGAAKDDDIATDSGAVYILFMNANGTVGYVNKISSEFGNWNGHIQANDRFGSAVASLGDVDGDGATDIAVGAIFNSVPNHQTSGAVWILMLRIDGSVGSHVEIDGNHAVMSSQVATSGQMGNAICMIDDLDGDGVREIAVGGAGHSSGGPARGVLHILYPRQFVRSAKEDEGCGINGGLHTPSAPLLGLDMPFSFPNSWGSQDTGTIPVLFLAGGSLATSGCGPLIPGWNLNPAQPAAELILGTPRFGQVVGTPWNGSGLNEVTLPIPDLEALLGLTFYVQGATVDPTPPPGGTRFGLTNGYRLTIGTLP